MFLERRVCSNTHAKESYSKKVIQTYMSLHGERALTRTDRASGIQLADLLILVNRHKRGVLPVATETVTFLNYDSEDDLR